MERKKHFPARGSLGGMGQASGSDGYDPERSDF